MLLKIIAGVEQADEGAIMLKKGLTLGYLDQIPIYPKEYTVIDILNEALKEIDIIKEEMKTLENKMVELKDIKLKKTLKQYSTL